jgi:hypothetical protein
MVVSGTRIVARRDDFDPSKTLLAGGQSWSEMQSAIARLSGGYIEMDGKF